MIPKQTTGQNLPINISLKKIPKDRKADEAMCRGCRGTEANLRSILAASPPLSAQAERATGKKEAVRSGYEQYLDSNGIKHKLIRPRTPQLNGKVERFNQTLKRCVRGRLKDGMSIRAIQRVIDEFLRIGTIRLDLILL